MSENFAEMLANEEWKEIHTGEVVDGTVIAVKDDQIVLNIGYKADGIITRSEYTSQPGLDLTTVVSVGDEMKAKVLKLNDGEGQVLLTYRKLVADNGNKKLEDALKVMKVLSTVEGTCALYPDSTLKAGLLPFKDAKADETFYADISDLINAGNTTPFIYSGWENTIVNTGTKMLEFMQDKASIKDVADQLDEDQDSVVNNQPEANTIGTNWRTPAIPAAR